MANSAGRPHVPEEELHAYCDGELSPAQRVEIAEHLLGCIMCRAQLGVVEAVRTRAASLLSIAVPATARRTAARSAGHSVARQRAPRFATAIAAAVVGFGVWFALKPEITNQGSTQLASSLGIAGVFGIRTPEVDSAGVRDRLLELGSRIHARPQVKSPGSGETVASTKVGIPVDVDAVVAADWTPSNFDSAVKVGGGVLARVDGLPIASVRVHPSPIGGRPTSMVRQALKDGRAIWVFEGLEEDIAPVSQLLQASGVATSIVTRTRPDYVGAGANLRVTSRMVTVAGFLPVDSLNVLATRLTLK